MRRAERRLAGLALLLAVAAATAAALSSPERLPPTLPQAQRDAVVARAAAWRALPPARQRELRQRLARWHALAPETQRRRREQWQAWQALPAAEQARLHAAAATFAALPAPQQQALRQRFDALDGSERRGWLLGPALGADYMRLQPLLAQVPAAQRVPLLAVLRAMSPAERGDLALLAQRSAPQQRDALRRGLLATSAANRRAWLQARLAQ